MRFCDFDIFSKKKPVGSSFHVYVMQVHARTRWVSVADLEKMLGKVRWALEEVSLYAKSCHVSRELRAALLLDR